MFPCLSHLASIVPKDGIIMFLLKKVKNQNTF
jgi:hypothetical protein